MNSLNPLNAELNPICHLLALLGAHHISHVSRLRVKVPKIKKILLYEIKFLLPNYSCLTRGLPSPSPHFLCPLSSTEFFDPTPEKIPGYATAVAGILKTQNTFMISEINSSRKKDYLQNLGVNEGIILKRFFI